jgi:transcriptional regulator with XRE-family HTH domain
MTQTSLGHRLRVLRAERGLSLREAASRTGVAKETISDIERGIRHPHDVTLSKLARGYGVPVGELLEEPVLAGKAEAPYPGPSAEDAQHRATLEEIRESYRESREGMDRYCARWEQRLAEDALDRHSVQEFLTTADALLPILRDSLTSELIEIHRELGDVEDSWISDEMRAESVMQPVVDRYFEIYFEIGRRLEEARQERFGDDADATDTPVIDFVAKQQERLHRIAG